MTFEKFDQRDEETWCPVIMISHADEKTWPDQQKEIDKDNDNDKNKDNDKDI